MNPAPSHAHLEYSILCDDVRLEAGNKLSLMGIFANIYFPSLPSNVLKFALLNHWVGNGDHITEIKIVSPDRSQIVASVPPSQFAISPGGFADNVTIFTNVVFHQEGTHFIHVYLDQILVREIFLHVTVIPPPSASVN
ncbi:MAG: hypothetical protein AB1898_12940 [Acidobacteriota bacterium]